MSSAAASHRRSLSRYKRVDQPRGDIVRTFLKIPDHSAPIGAASHKSGRHGRKVYVNVSDSRVRKVSLRASRKDAYGLAGLDDGKTFANGCDRGPSRDRKT
jgi:hypothetical protein